MTFQNNTAFWNKTNLFANLQNIQQNVNILKKKKRVVNQFTIKILRKTCFENYLVFI
jgi:hypothetical protein